MKTSALWWGMGLLAATAGPQAWAQNEPPALTNVKVSADTLQKQIVIRYDLADAEEKAVNVGCSISLDKGNTYPVTGAALKGDKGYPVGVGKGKQIVWHYGDRPLPLHEVKIQLVADDQYQVPIAQLVDQVDTARMLQNVKAVSGLRDRSKKGLQQLETVRNLLEQQFKATNALVTRQIFKADFDSTLTGQNIIGRKAGVQQGPGYVLCAHYDAAAKSPGGDDNATGVAGMLEIMRILAPYRFKHNIDFIGFDCEETHIAGSRHYVRQLKGPVAGAINLDMIGYASEEPGSQAFPEGMDVIFPEVRSLVEANQYRGNFVINVANQPSEALGTRFAESAQQYVPALKLITLVAPSKGELTPSLAATDHAAFWRAGYPAIHLGDGGETRNPHTNGKNDTPAIVNARFMGNVTKAALATLAELAQLQHSTTVYADLVPKTAE